LVDFSRLAGYGGSAGFFPPFAAKGGCSIKRGQQHADKKAKKTEQKQLFDSLGIDDKLETGHILVLAT
jgi:hypothetical protein